MEVDWKHGKCRNCGKEALVTLIIGVKDNKLFAGEICHDCLVSIQGKKDCTPLHQES